MTTLYSIERDDLGDSDSDWTPVGLVFNDRTHAQAYCDETVAPRGPATMNLPHPDDPAYSGPYIYRVVEVQYIQTLADMVHYRLQTKRKAALAKLSEEDMAVLGITPFTTKDVE